MAQQRLLSHGGKRKVPAGAETGTAGTAVPPGLRFGSVLLLCATRSRFALPAAPVASFLLLISGCATVHGPIQWEKWRDTYPEEYSMPLADKAALVEEHLVSHHLSPEGVLIYRRVHAPLVPGSKGAYKILSDEPIWSGALVGALAFKFKVTGEPQDRELLLRTLKGVKFLQDVTGKPGLLSRCIFPKGEPDPPGEGDPGEWRDAPEPHADYRYWGDVSKDQYFGVLFGYAATAVALGIDSENGDAEIRELMKEPACAIADHIWDNGCRIVDVDGKTTSFGNLPGFILGVPIGPNAGLVLGFQLLAHRLSGEAKYRDHYEELIEKRYHKATKLIKFDWFGLANYNNDNMSMMAFHALANMEGDPEILRIYELNLGNLWCYDQNHGNAFFHLVYGSRNELSRSARFDLRENLRLYPKDPVVRSVDVQDHPAVQRAFFNNRFCKPRNRTAIPLHLRRRSAFLWKTDPFQLVWTEEESGTESVSGVDYLLAYWMARMYLGDPEALPEGP